MQISQKKYIFAAKIGKPFIVNQATHIYTLPQMSSWMQGKKSIFPKWFTQYAVLSYILALAIVTVMYFAYRLPLYYLFAGIISVGVFFLYGSKVAQYTAIEKMYKEKNFEKRIFRIAFVPRLIWTLLIYIVFMRVYGDPFGFENADACFYNDLGQYVSSLR